MPWQVVTRRNFQLHSVAAAGAELHGGFMDGMIASMVAELWQGIAALACIIGQSSEYW
jgi:hypothetical protein